MPEQVLTMHPLDSSFSMLIHYRQKDIKILKTLVSEVSHNLPVLAQAGSFFTFESFDFFLSSFFAFDFATGNTKLRLRPAAQ